MSSSDNQYIALGPADIGFKTHATRITTGGEFHGTLAGVVGRVQTNPGGSGVLGFSPTTGSQCAGVVGTSLSPAGNGVIADAHEGPSAYAVWARSRSGLAARFDGKVMVNGDFIVQGGAKSAVVPLSDGTARLLYAIESPESWFEDFGFGHLSQGYARVSLDEVFASIIRDDAYHVFITEYEESNSLYVTGRTRDGFEVRSKTATGNSEFSYRIVAKRSDIPATRFAEASVHEKPSDEDVNTPEDAS
jgi:hypothetical protein